MTDPIPDANLLINWAKRRAGAGEPGRRGTGAGLGGVLLVVGLAGTADVGAGAH